MKIYHYFAITFCLLAMISCKPTSSLEIRDLKCEQLTNPVAIDNTMPCLSWELCSNHRENAQAAYQILAATERQKLVEGKADIWDSGKIISTQSHNVAFGGKTLESKSFVYWKVRVWDQADECSDWSEVASFGIGLLHPEDWKAGYIGMEQPDGKSLSPLFRKQFECDEVGEMMILHVNSLGYHEVYINGEAATDAVLTPAVSQFNKRSQIVAYNITKLMHKGKNDIVILAGKGWYQEGLPGVIANGPYLRAQLENLKENYWETLLVTDSLWSVRKSGYESFGDWRPHRFGGEIITASELLPDYTTKTLDNCQWSAVKTVEIKEGISTPQMVELNRIKENFHPVTVQPAEEHAWIFDMGTNFTGWTRIAFPQLQPGQKVRISYCDFLNADGSFRDGAYEDYYIASGKPNEVFINKFNYKAYRYLKLSNVEAAPALSDITAYLIHTDYSDNASFSCSDEDLNTIYNMIHYTLRCLTLGGYMVDCPQIERLGYGGDGNASTQTVQTLFNMAPTYANWIEAWADCMREDGGMPHTAPNPYTAGGGPYWCGFIITASWTTYVNYGDVRLLERYYPYMQKWLGYVAQHTHEGLLKPWPNTDYRGWYLGDWATPSGINQTDPLSIDLVDNCYLSYCFQTMAKIAAVLNKESDKAAYMDQARSLNKLIHKTFYDEEQHGYSTQTQIDMVYPMLVGATPAEICPMVETSLKEITAERFKGHLATGLVGIPVITEWAVKNNQAEFIYSMLKKRDYPGYLYMIDNGATTTWEHWNGERSHIHNCYNAIGSWFYQALAGIQPDETHPAYEGITIRPQFVEGISWVKAKKDTPYGQLGVEWEKNADALTISVQIPVGSHATLCLPVKQMTENGQPLDEVAGVKMVRSTDEGLEIKLSHGSYCFNATFRDDTYKP